MNLTGLVCEDERFVYGFADPVREARSLLSLLSQAFHRDFSYEEYEWFKLKHPFFPSRAYVAHEKSTDRLASMMCMRPLAYRIGGKEHVASLAVSAATHPDFRRLGLFHKINEIMADQTPSGKQLWVGVSQSLHHQVLGWLYQGGLADSGSSNFFREAKTEKKWSRLISIPRFDESYDDLCHVASESYDFCHLKEHRTLNWRYLEKPGAEYRVLPAREGVWRDSWSSRNSARATLPRLISLILRH